ncbi:hypothetical protein GDO86_006934 [Hymenochirus boettgeri]|uniref:Uncharacterized protein n=1 Tax=Hymenochirus boettgeri TaxID=247094 RepID=A0A8T2JCJ6_9PIPI|nr:hypothetical protein GDO86_006934 [Hymenochirus boettgeri]
MKISTEICCYPRIARFPKHGNRNVGIHLKKNETQAITEFSSSPLLHLTYVLQFHMGEWSVTMTMGGTRKKSITASHRSFFTWTVPRVRT